VGDSEYGAGQDLDVASSVTDAPHALGFGEDEAYRTLLYTVGDAVLIADLESSVFLVANPAAVELLGYSCEELVSMSAHSLHPSGQGDIAEAIIQEARMAGSVRRSEVMLQRKDGSCFWAELRIGAYTSGDRRCYAAIIRDVTERVERDRELRRAHAELEAAHAQMLHNNKLVALGQIAAGVAHEVNNPASYVLMNLDEVAAVLDRGESAFKSLRSSLLAWLDGEQRERAEECLAGFPVHRIFREGRDLVTECVDGVQRITSLVRDLRGFARIDESDVCMIGLNDVVVTACKIVGPHLRQRAHLNTHLESTRFIAADRRRLVQVITNLLVNAGQALEEGYADEQLIEVTTQDEEDSVVIRVRDTGPGIEAELIERIFDPFFTTKRERGTGLGLSLCSDIVRQHAGSVGVFSAPGQGAVFEVRLPFDTGLAPAQPGSSVGEESVPSRAARVLVIDDEPQLVRAYRRILGRHHHVTVATGGAAGLALIEKNPDFDAIVCDLTMPDVDGVRIYRSLDRLAPHLKARVIFSSGGAFTRRAEELLSTIQNPFLEKPVDPLELLDAIERVRNKRTPSEPPARSAGPLISEGPLSVDEAPVATTPSASGLPEDPKRKTAS
jgi:PAS domain S-box-containing protein